MARRAVGRRPVRRAAALVAAVLMLGTAAPPAAIAGPEPVPDIVVPDPPPLEQPPSLSLLATFDPFADDPLGLVGLADFVGRYSVGVDRFEVWKCDVPFGTVAITFDEILDVLELQVAPYYDFWSGGAYQPTFTTGGTVSAADYFGCVAEVGDASPGTYEAAVIVTDDNLPGFASAGPVCVEGLTCVELPRTFPGNGRYVVVGGGLLPTFPQGITHEIGHSIHWPHSYSGESFEGGVLIEYDNPIDLMSGNRDEDGFSPPASYGTLAFNRYAAGWIDPGDVVVFGGGIETVTLRPADGAGKQLLVAPTARPGVMAAAGVRVTRPDDPIPASYEGVEVYLVDQDCDLIDVNFMGCPGIISLRLQAPPSPYGVGHVLQSGEYAVVEGTRISVSGRSGDAFALRVVGFSDIGGSTFVDDILWLADEDITKGCGGTLFCPGDDVTRGQMAAFLVRALGLSTGGDGSLFVDDDASIFEADIEKLAVAGITKGCNPPTNDRFCPDAPVTRGQMAAFLVRALGYTDPGGGDLFTDDDTSVFEGDIEKLAVAGITKGCNPPTNTLFCPNDFVTRGQMAAFLHRALG